METIGVDIPIELKMVKSSFQKQMEGLDDNLYKKHSYQDIQLDEHFDLLAETSHPNRFFYEEYFKSRRIPYDDIILFTTGQFRGLAAIPMMFYDKLIGVQVVTLEGKYIKLFYNNTDVLYIPESRIQDPVIVVEGALDAKCFPNTVATLGSHITPKQAYFLRGKHVIMVPDKKGNKFIDQFYKYGWAISLPEWGNDCKDLNDAVCRYGVISVAEMIRDSEVKDRLRGSIMYRDWIRGYNHE
jgi:hypothetical protein